MLKNIEQKRDEKVQQYYERFAKLVNSLQTAGLILVNSSGTPN